MRRALSHAVYRRLFLAQVVALAGTGLATVALALLAFELAGSDAGTVLGTALAVKMVAYVLVAPVAAAAVVRLPRRAVLVAADLVRLAVAATLPFVGEVWQVYVLVLVLQAASATFTPTFQSTIPDVLTDEDDYTAALSLSRLAYDLEAVLSPVLAAALLLLVPSNALFGGTAVGFAASAVLVAGTALPPRATHADVDTPERAFGAQARHGIDLLVRSAALRPVLALNVAVAAAGAFVLVQTVVVARTALGQDEGVVALLLAVMGGGSMLAALALPAVLRSVPEKPLMLGGGVLLAVATALVPLALGAHGTAALVAVGVLWLLVGVGWSAVETPVGRLLRRHVDGPDLGAAFAAQFSLSHACWLVTYPAVGWLGAVTLDGAALTMAVVAAGATVAAALLWRRAPGTGARNRAGDATSVRS
ncbi:MFS transporter [Cellulomonas fimi]|uniref:Major facilitator superfamily MFS_1 n=1 Tax=Cellulomonas fimi (strain ATCC 484 / DSM 20113 / JCM 1341 / CCUG 24087 / LMG 16345 / NBRC 15513 / NCIMB 8980 / NCTC 7547 / NRS-133) TaxID=590998 RepID=F4H703_CELFA|nr:MFS transporter [Cellulomonas fimi]AEE44512.1 major facilitator superfamily MFS_1 [Cellulomonas fimi ATCC 484]VEH26509.1 H+ Antiporter protein [Cellulomonas fimi]